MNQILVTKDKKNNSKYQIKPIIMFFAIVILILALIFIGEGAYNLYKSKQNNDYPQPTLNVEKNGSDLNLQINGQIGINKVQCSWNDGSDTIFNGDGRKEVDLEVDIPQGRNTINIVVIDVEGNKTKFNHVVSFEGEDTNKPKITVISSVGKIKITATDETELDYITYKWQDEEEVKVQVTPENKKTIEQEISVNKGTKDLRITAIDKSGNKEQITRTVIGSNGPKIDVKVDGNYLVAKVTDEITLTKIEYTYNEKDFVIEDIQPGTKEYEFRLELKDGTNYLKIVAYENELKAEYKCKKTK